MIYCDDDFDTSMLEPIRAYLTTQSVELLIVDNERMREINRDTRNIDATTDVLSYPYDITSGCKLAGSIVINAQLAEQTSKSLGHSLDDEICLMFIHGMLHVLGYDHESDDGQMRERECELIKHFGLPQSLIVRTLG